MNSDFPVERYDQLVIKMATLRHFNRKTSGCNEIGMGTINACLRPEQPISLDEIKQQARDRIKIERRMGKLKAEIAAARAGLADIDPGDYTRMAEEMTAISAREEELAGVEESWMELSERLEGA